MKLGEPKGIKLKALTPIFIGSGEAIRPLSYLVDGTFVHILDADKFFEQLTDQERQRYLDWIEPILDSLSDLETKIAQARDNFDLRRQLQRQRRNVEAELSSEAFIRSQLLADPVPFARSRESIAYSLRYAAKPGNDGFGLHIKDAKYNPYIPGTEIKGALRTSLLYALLADDKNYDWLRDSLSRFRAFFRSGASPRKKVKEFSKIAGGLEGKLLRGGGNKDDAKFDFFKLVQISDSISAATDCLQIEAIQSLGTQRYTRTLVETVTRGSEFASSIAIAEDSWILQRLGLERLAEWLSIPGLLKASFIRSRDILEEEASYFQNYQGIPQLIAQLQQENQPHSPLLRLGQGQGLLGTTINLQLKKHHDEQLYEEAIREGVSFQRRWRTQRGNFPKTRRVVIDLRNTPKQLLGWVKLIL